MHILKKLNFCLVWSSYTISAFSTSLVPVVLTLFIIDSMSRLDVLGAVLGARTLGFILGAVFSGVITDHFRHKWVLFSSSLIRAVATLLMLSAFWFRSIPLMCGIIVFLGAGEGFFRSAYQAVVADITSGYERQAANAASTLSMRLSLTIAPMLATIMYSLMGGYPTLILAAVLWLISAVIILFLREQGGAATDHPLQFRLFLSRYREGYREALLHRWFIAGLCALAVWLSLSYSVQQLILPLVSQNIFGNNSVMGVALGCYSAGAIVASLVLSKWHPRYPGVMAFIALSFYGLVPFALYYQENSGFIYLAYFIGGVGIEAFNIPWFTAIQNEVPKQLIGRISSFDFLVSYAISPLALAVLPLGISLFGSSAILLCCGGLTIIASLAALFVPGVPSMHDPRQKERQSSRAD